MNRKIGAIFSYVLMFFEVASSFIFTPFLIRSFGQSEYGVYSLTISITSYLALLDLGVGNAIVRYISKYRIDNDIISQQKLKATLIVFYFFISLLAIAIGVVLSLCFDKLFSSGLNSDEIVLARKLLLIVILNSAVTLLFTPYSKTILAYEHYSISKLLDIFKIFFRIGISFIALFIGGKSLSIALINLLTTIIFSLITLIICNKLIPIKPNYKFKDKSFLKEITCYSVFVFLQMIAYQLNAMTDHILLGVLSSSVIIAVYQVGANISSYFQNFSNGINSILQPSIVRLIETNKNNENKEQLLEEEMIKISRLLFIFLGLIYVVFLINGKKFIYLWVGDDYKESYLVSIILLTPLLFTLSQRVGTYALWTVDKHKTLAILQIGIGVINIASSYFLIVFYNDLIGAAIGTSIASFVGDYFVLNIVFKKELGINVIKYNVDMVKNTIFALLISGIVGFSFSFLNFDNAWISFLLNCSLMVFAYLVCMFLFGFNSYEKNLIRSMTKKILRK